MNEAASVFLRAKINQRDGYRLAEWMRNRNVTRYLNEEINVSDELIALMERTPEGMLSYHLNQNGRFFQVSREGSPIGFVRLTHCPEEYCEIVYVIGEERLWGHGYGKRALELALAKAFYEMRKEVAFARIHEENTRSTGTAVHCGMKLTRKSGHMQIYQITAREFMEQQKRSRGERMQTDRCMPRYAENPGDLSSRRFRLP